ncbi:MAG: hypothetical protein A4E63_00649 [Syntrophorhabdus sp. PtaU1.Bin050]|nr:MAG: hypothetical protein A4E63_00649 [Syntrophorhabdus sp. PtaU1.Bin050]
MIFLIVLGCMALYIVLSIIFVSFIAVKFTKKPFLTLLAIIFVILLPTWDIVLGMIVYFPACLFVSKVAIYETAETEGIYYEGMHDYMYLLSKGREDEPLSERIQVGTISDVFREGYTYAESKIVRERTEKYFEYRPIPPVYYRCTPLPKNPQAPAYEGTNCIAIDQPTSRYMMKVTEIKAGIGGIQTKKIIDRITGKLMAEYRQAMLEPFFPFFNWLYQADGGGAMLNCFGSDRYYYFEYEILKPIKK